MSVRGRGMSRDAERGGLPVSDGIVAKALMFQGTGSDVGKSLLVAGFCRAFARRGLRVKPFKPQNMSNNAAVTPDGGEIGRAQALQARACCVRAERPYEPGAAEAAKRNRRADRRAGQDFRNGEGARLSGAQAETAAATSLESFASLRESADLVLVEGAGSPAEINLRAGDIANMGFARAPDVPVVLIGDIDRGGVIAQIVGTKTVLDPADAAMVRGFIVNKFRGDASLFAQGMEMIAARTGWPGLGLIPFFPRAARLPAEDAMALARPDERGRRQDDRRRASPAAHQQFRRFRSAQAGARRASGDRRAWRPPAASATSSSCPARRPPWPISRFLRAQGWDVDLRAHARRGGKVLGICGGYQMLGRKIADPLGMEGPPAQVDGLGLLDVETELTADKVLRACGGVSTTEGAAFSGYEMHVGVTHGPDAAQPFLSFADGRGDGALSPDGNIRACYVHGLFAHEDFRASLLRWIGAETSELAYEAEVERILDALADHLARHVDLDALLALAR